MNEQSICPTVEHLTKLSNGDLPGDSFEKISGHLEGCTACQRRLANLDIPPDDFTRALSKLDLIDLERAGQKMDSESHHDSNTWLRHFFESAAERSRQLAPTLKTPCRLGPYDVIGKIGHGGMGEVYEARHSRLNRPVALKVIRGNRQDDPAAHARFLQEMSTTGKFDHPNLVRAYDAWEADGCLYLVLELLEGDSLQKLADEGRLNTAEEVRQIMLDLCRALEHLHASGLVHRDIKPSNVMKLRNGNLKLIDYGLTIDQVSDPGTSVKLEGTVGYMAPEQAVPGRPIDARCDIFSAGRLLQHLLWKLPDWKPGPDKPEPIRKLERIAARMTQADPDERYPNAAEVERSLRSIESPDQGNGARRAFAGLTILALIAFAGSYAVTLRNAMIVELNARDPISADRLPKRRTPFELRMVRIPAGSFLMGGNPNDKYYVTNESPNRLIKIEKPFRMSATEVTVAQFREFVETTGYRTEAELSGEGGWKASGSSSWGTQRPDFIWSSPGYTLSDKLPVTMITYADAIAYCDWLSRREGRKFRLPSEAEWEYACRAGTTTPTHFPPEARDSYCWSIHNNRSLTPRPVASREPNPWGLYDMNGNVREWCLDWYAEDAYRRPFEEFPTGPPTGTMRVVRSNCFIDKESMLRSSWRGYLKPTDPLNNQGFRVVCEE